MEPLLGGGEVAVVGGGPAGLAVAKHLLERGFEPLVLERAEDLGGQWNRRSPHSAVWRGMRANTSKTTTAFSDLLPPRDVPMFPCPDAVQAYLREYAKRFGVAERLRTGARVTCVSRSGGGWTVRWNEGSTATERRFDGVVVASGRFAAPRLPAGLLGAEAGPLFLHSRDYQTRDEFRGLRVLVYGNGASGIEIACDLAVEDSVEVVSACSRPRFVLPKISRGVPCEWTWLSDYAGLLARGLDRRRSPGESSAPALEPAGDPHPSVLATGIVHCQEFLPFVAEGRIEARPAVECLSGGVAKFADGSRDRFDAVIVATGYEPSFTFLPPELRPACGATLRRRTLHPAFPSVAFVGQFRMDGPHLPVLELQARWLAACWAGDVDAPPPGRTRARAAGDRRPAAGPVDPSVEPYHGLVAEFAGALGVVPRRAEHPDLAASLVFGPPAPTRWRLDGPGSRPGAEAEFAAAVEEFGPPAPPCTARIARLRALARSLGEPELSEAAAAIERLA